ncbi:glutamine amidotransferase [Gammaproteobacteria bacterium]|nr:glutamine amidotransferase [Gammaproteobacteria bacterium]
MSRKIMVIEHHDEFHDDLASIHLQTRGFDVEWCQPFRNQPLTAPDPEWGGVVILGGAANVDEMDRSPYLYDEARWIEKCLEHNIPMLGLCLGAQLIAHVLGAKVAPHADGLEEFGFYKIQSTVNEPEFVPKGFVAAQYHSRGFEIPNGAEKLASGALFPNQAFRYNHHVVGTQFHPECTREIWKRWQVLDGAPWEKPGAQSREEQNRLSDVSLSNAGQWFIKFLDELF